MLYITLLGAVWVCQCFVSVVLSVSECVCVFSAQFPISLAGTTQRLLCTKHMLTKHFSSGNCSTPHWGSTRPLHTLSLSLSFLLCPPLLQSLSFSPSLSFYSVSLPLSHPCWFTYCLSLSLSFTLYSSQGKGCWGRLEHGRISVHTAPPAFSPSNPPLHPHHHYTPGCDCSPPKNTKYQGLRALGLVYPIYLVCSVQLYHITLNAKYSTLHKNYPL